ncbi:MAG: hypothetical protein AAFU86_11480, partial [Pseudomonadota bacterium]
MPGPHRNEHIATGQFRQQGIDKDRVALIQHVGIDALLNAGRLFGIPERCQSLSFPRAGKGVFAGLIY